MARNKVAKLEPKVKKPSFLKRLTSLDGWANRVTGMGILGRDKAEATTYRPDVQLDQTTLDELGRSDSLSMKHVGRLVDDAMRQGWVVTFKSDDENKVTVEEAIELNEKLEKKYKEIQLKPRLTQHLKQSRQYGGSILLLGAPDGQSPDEPLNPEAVSEFTWMRSHDRYQVTSTGGVENEPRSRGFGFPKWYTMQRTAEQTGSDPTVPIEDQLYDVRVHNSRVWRTDGTPILSDRVRIRNGGWSDSVLQHSNEAIGTYNSSIKSSKTLMQEASQWVYKLKDLQDVILANGSEAVRERFHLMDHVKSIHGALMVDADMEDARRDSISFAGIPDVIDRHQIKVASDMDMPVTLAFGVSPSGFGTGEAEGDNWDDTTKAYQTDTIQPALEHILGILFQTKEFVDFPSNWAIKFNALQLANPLEEADIRLKTSQADVLDIQAGILDADEVALSRYGGSVYSTETMLDEAGRLEMAELEAEGEGLQDDTVEPLNGAQVTSMVDILTKAGAGEIPKESAKVALDVAFPGRFTTEQINGMIDPIEVKVPEEPTPPAPPPSALDSAIAAVVSPSGGAVGTMVVEHAETICTTKDGT